MTPAEFKVLYQDLVEKLPEVTELPNEGFLSANKFALKAGTSLPTLRKAFIDGRFNLDHCCVMISASHAKQLFIDWNAAAVYFIKARNKNKWPKDFDPKAKKYKPIKVTKKGKLKKEKKEKKKDALAHLVNLPEAKLATEKLKIQQLQVEIQIANNEAIKVEKACQVAQGIAYAVKSQLRRYIVLSSPDMLRCKNVQEVRTKQEEHMQPVLDELEQLLVDTVFTEEKE